MQGWEKGEVVLNHDCLVRNNKSGLIKKLVQNVNFINEW